MKIPLEKKPTQKIKEAKFFLEFHDYHVFTSDELKQYLFEAIQEGNLKKTKKRKMKIEHD